MFRTLLNAYLLAITLLFCTTSLAAPNSLPTLDTGTAIVPLSTTPQLHSSQPKVPYIRAKSYILIDANTGYIIAQKNAHQKLSPASLTKLMSLYVTANALHNHYTNLDDKVLISKKAWSTGGSRLFVKAGTHVSLATLIQGVIVASGNDATIAMAQHVGGDIPSFVKAMNAAAKELGLKESHFMNPTGLPTPGHYSTAYDLAVLARAVNKHFPEYYHWYKQKWITYNKIKQPNRNRLLWHDESVDGMKTGHTEAAGYCLIASAKRDTMRLISVVLGAPSEQQRIQSSQKLLNYGFNHYTTYTLYHANQPIAQPRVWFGRSKKVNLGVTQDLMVTLPKRQYDKVHATVRLADSFKAPIQKGQPYATLDITLGKKVLSHTPLLALDDDPKGGMWVQLKDRFLRLIDTL